MREERERERKNNLARKGHGEARDRTAEPKAARKEGIDREAREKSNGWIGEGKGGGQMRQGNS